MQTIKTINKYLFAWLNNGFACVCVESSHINICLNLSYSFFYDSISDAFEMETKECLCVAIEEKEEERDFVGLDVFAWI